MTSMEMEILMCYKELPELCDVGFIPFLGFSQALSNNLDCMLSGVLGRHYCWPVKMSSVIRLLCAVIT